MKKQLFDVIIMIGVLHLLTTGFCVWLTRAYWQYRIMKYLGFLVLAMAMTDINSIISMVFFLEPEDFNIPLLSFRLFIKIIRLAALVAMTRYCLTGNGKSVPVKHELD